MLSQRWWLWIMPALFLACGGGDGGNTTADVVVTETVQDTAEADATPCTLTADISDWYYHIEHLRVFEPAGEDGVLAETLTSLWNTQISKDQLIILFHVTRFDANAGELWFEVGSAVKHPNGNYQMVANPPPEVVKTMIDGCRLLSSEDGILKVYPDLVTVPIPVVQLRVDANLTADGTGILEGGTLTGGICTTDAKVTNFKLFETQSGCTNFYKFISDVGLSPEATGLSCALGGSDGYAFVGSFDARRITNVETGTITVERTFSCD